MQIFHKCGNPAIVVLNNSIEFIGIPSLTGNGVFITNVILGLNNPVPTFKCGTCNEMIGINELLVRCGGCGKLIEIKEVLITKDENIVCPTCAKKYDFPLKKNQIKLEFAK